MATPSLPKLKAFLDIEEGEDAFDLELADYLASATGTIARRCGYLEPTEVVEQIRVSNDALVVSEWPVVTVTSAVDDDGASVDVSTAKIDRGAGIIRLGGGVNGLIEVTYQAGYDPCPEDLEMATYVVAGHLWDTQRGRTGAFTQVHGLDDDAPVGGDASFFVLQGRALPRRAMELTRPYTKAGLR